jgi:ABC-type amino acid transport substrate-binding protein
MLSKRFTILVASAITALMALTACASGASDEGSGSQSPEQQVLRVGADASFAPYIFEEDGQIVGIEADVLYAIGENLGMEVEIQKIGFDSLIPSLQAGRIDVAAVGGWADGEKRRATMNMVAYFNAYSGLLVQSGEETNRLADLCGKTVSALAASVYVPALEDASVKCTDAGNQAIDILQLDQDGATLAVKSGRAFARLDEGGLGGYIASQDNTLQMNTVTDFETFSAALGVSLENTQLAEEITTALEEIRASGQLAEIFSKWGLPDSWIVEKITLNGE